MRNRVVRAMIEMRDNGGITLLRQSPDLEIRHLKLMELLPEIQNWRSLIIKHQLIFYLQRNFQIELGVCEHYLVDDYQQYCEISGCKIACSCLIPQGFCMLRDQDNKPRYPEFTPCLKLFRIY